VGLSRPLPSSWTGGRVSARNPLAFSFSKEDFFLEKPLNWRCCFAFPKIWPAEFSRPAQLRQRCISQLLPWFPIIDQPAMQNQPACLR
jgi:hypothetical protein